MKVFTILLSISLSVLLSSQFSNGQVTQEWIKLYNGTGNNTDQANHMVIDNTGNIYVTGYSVGSGTGQDFLTIKYNSNGDSLWVKRYNGPANGTDQAKFIAIDGLGNILVAGFSAGIGTGASDYTTIKYSSNGDFLWERRYNGPGNSSDEAISLVIDASNNVYITGYSTGNGTGSDYATLKYNSLGSLQWTRRYNGPGNGNDQAKSIAIDGSGNISVTGFSLGIGTGTSDYATIKYNSLGDSLWVKRYNGSANGIDQANSLVVDSSGSVYVTGYSAGTGTGASDYATIKYNSTGDSLWVRRYNGTGNNVDQANSIKVDNSGNTYVTGNSVGSGTGNDFVTIKYDLSGVQQWVQRYNRGDDHSKFLALDSLGSIYVTGFGGSGSFPDYIVLKYNSNGDSLWIQTYNNNFDEAFSIALDGLRRVYVTGKANNNYATIKYSQQLTLYLKTLFEGFYDNFSNKMIRDTARVYLRSANPPYAVIDSVKTYLDSNGTAILNFFNALYGSPYYIVVKHRNSIETWSKLSVPFTTSLNLNYDFTTHANKAFGDNQVLKGSKYCVYSGDINQDGLVDVFDMSQADNDAFNSTGGYVQSDVNGDFFVDLSDLAIVDNNAFNIVEVKRPFTVNP